MRCKLKYWVICAEVEEIQCKMEVKVISEIIGMDADAELRCALMLFVGQQEWHPAFETFSYNIFGTRKVGRLNKNQK